MITRGDIVLVRYPFTDFSETKLRPALVLVPEDEEGDYILSFITSVSVQRGSFDVQILASERNGLHKDSMLRLKKMMTIHKSLIAGRIGTVSEKDLETIRRILKLLLQL